LEGFLKGHRIWIPHFVMARDKYERRRWIAEHGITDLFTPHWDGPGTSFSGAETLAQMSINGATTGPTVAPGVSLLTRECLEPIAASYFRQAGNKFLIRAFGTTLSTSVITTQQIVLVTGPTLASPLTGGVTLASNTAWTPAAAVTGNWWLDVTMSVRTTGSSGTMMSDGFIVNDIVTAGTVVNTPFRNANPPTSVAVSTAGGFLVPLYFDLNSVQGAATAGNSAVCLDYTLISL
jgi:hypothetical protein